MTEARVNRPTPIPTELTQPFWDAARRHRLAVQQCNVCGFYQHPPNTVCPQCLSTSLGWTPVAGVGRVYAYTVMNAPVVKGFEAIVPYACILVELIEQPRLLILTNLVEAPPSAAAVGLEVEVVFEDSHDGFVLPQFRPRSSQGIGSDT